jgi:hypothetical protein
MQAQIPAIAAEYFGPDAAHPLIAQAFYPGWGWIRSTLRKRVSRSWLRKLRREGATHVALVAAHRHADFSIRELLRRS